MRKPSAEISDPRQKSTTFGALPEITKHVTWLRRIEGLSQFAAARRLGIKEGALEGHMSRGLRSLMRKVN